ncbi:MAG: patatin-like phospholipase family protein [Patescibacteria group bacterium]|nr:patatin-like phospholipase family protein [Patescibacteria group bacterium]
MSHPQQKSEPIRLIPGDEGKKPEKGIALCLSGGGYRAMIFHLGCLWRMNELGLLRQLKRVSSVSGGSITAGYLGYRWKDLRFDSHGTAANFKTKIVAPLRALASKTIDVPAIAEGAILPGTVADYIVGFYRQQLFDRATLQNLPDERKRNNPRFIINATNLQSTALWRFSRASMADYRVGEIRNPKLPLAVAVAASAGFPPVLSPVELKLNPSSFAPRTGSDLRCRAYRSKVVLCDGGVYDNLGLETVYKKYETILVSDACAPTAPEEDPPTDWARQSLRVIFMIQNEVQALRKRQLIGSFKLGQRAGAYWGIASRVEDYRLRDHLPVPSEYAELANVPTRLAAMTDDVQEKLINWGYVIADVALRKHYYGPTKKVSPPPSYPYPKAAKM